MNHRLIQVRDFGNTLSEEKRFEVTVFRLQEYEYAMAVQTNGGRPYHHSRHLARTMRDAIVQGE